MNLNRFLSLVCTAVSLLLAPLAAQAQDKPLEWVVGYPAGGGSDAVARVLAEHMGKTLGRNVIVNNKPGAATNIAAEYVARSKDFGNIMFSADFATLAANPSLFAKLGYDAERDLAPVGLIARFPMVLVVHPAVPARDLKQFVAWARTQHSGVNFASAGIGSPHHLIGELLRERTGMNLAHVAYRGAAPAVQDLIGGQVSAAMMDTTSVLQHLASGKLRALGVASLARVDVLPELPTLAEQGLAGFEAHAWQGLVVPAGTPPAQVDQLNRALVDALKATAVKARLHVMGLEGLPGRPAQLMALARSERERWGRLIRAQGIKPD